MLELGMNEDLYSLLVGSITIGGLFGSLVSGKMADMIGRRRGLGVAMSISAVGWLGVATSISPAMIFSARIVHGIGEGIAVAISIFYLGELIEEKYRGGAISSINISCLFGIALAYVMSMFIPWRISATINGIINLVSILLTLIIPESPQWKKFKDNTKKKENAESMEKKKESKKSAPEDESLPTAPFSRAISISIPLLLLLLSPVSGVYSISFYAASIARNLQIEQPTAVAIAVSLIRTVGCGCGVAFVQLVGRRASLIISAGTQILFLVLVSVLLLVDSIQALILNWSLTALLFLVMFSSSLGMTPTPWILCGEWPAVKDKVILF